MGARQPFAGQSLRGHRVTLSKAAWLAVRPAKLKGLAAGRLMEALRARPGDDVGAWQRCLADCDALQAVLDRTPRMLTRNMTEPFRDALKVWYRDIDGLRRQGDKALSLLGPAYVDAICTAVAQPVQQEAQALIKAMKAAMKAVRKRAPGDRDRNRFDQLTPEVERACAAIRDLRKTKARVQIKSDPTAKDIIRAKYVRLRSFKMSCDPMLKELLKAATDMLADYADLMKTPAP